AAAGEERGVGGADPPAMPPLEATCGSTGGEEMISLPSTIAPRRAGSPAGAQAALPVTCAQARPPEPRKSTVTYQVPRPSGSVWAAAPVTPAPVSAAGPRRSGW